MAKSTAYYALCELLRHSKNEVVNYVQCEQIRRNFVKS